MSIKVSCSCGQSFKAKDELAGKKVRCPKCKNPLTIPAPVVDDFDDLALAAPANVQKYNPLDDILNEEGVQAASSGPQCPSCSEPITSPHAVICIQCGFNLATGEKMSSSFDDDDDDEDDEYQMAGMTETEKMIYKAEKEIEDMPISADGEKFGDEGDSFIVAIVALLVVGLVVGLGVFAIMQLDQIEDFDTVTVSFWMSILFIVGTMASVVVIAFKENAMEGYLCLTVVYIEYYAATRGLYVQLGLLNLFGAIAGGCGYAMGQEAPD